MSKIPKCPLCGSEIYVKWDPATNSYVCTVHGLVVEDRVIDSGPEWRSFDAEEKAKRSRIGAPLTARVHDYGVTTFIRASPKDLRSMKLAALQARLRRSSDEKLVKILSELNSLAARLGLSPQATEMAARLVREISSIKMLRRNNLYEYIAAALVIAAKMSNSPMTIKEVSEKLNLHADRVWAAYREILSSLKLKIGGHNPQLFIPKIISKLKLSPKVETLANKIAYMLVKQGIAQGKPPQAVAAAAVYIASILLDEKRNQAEVAKAIDMTDATIRNRYRDIVDNFYIEVKL